MHMQFNNRKIYCLHFPSDHCYHQFHFVVITENPFAVERRVGCYKMIQKIQNIFKQPELALNNILIH